MLVELVASVSLLYKFYLDGLDERKYEFELFYTSIVILSIINGCKMPDDHFKLICGDLDNVLSRHNIGFYDYVWFKWIV